MIKDNVAMMSVGSNRQKSKMKCNFCGKMGDKEAFCFAKDSNERNLKCHNCGVSGNIAKDCRKPKQNIKYCSFCKINNRDRSECRKLRNATSSNESANLLREMNLVDEKGFCFFASSDNSVFATNEVDLIINSGCTNYMLKDREMFATLDESFSGSAGCANNFESEIKGKGRAEFYVCEDNGNRAKITLSEALFVSDYGKNLVSVSKLKNSGNKVEFGDND